jgi:hypothetical protein
MIRKLSLALLSAIPALIHAEDCCMPDYTPGEPLCNPCAGYSQYAGTELDCGWDISATGEFLYWRPFGSVSWVATVVPQNPLTESYSLLAFKWGYKPGFRVGLGIVAHRFDDWIFNIDYLRYHQAFSKTMSVSLPNSLFSNQLSLLGAAGGFASSIKNKAHYHYDVAGVNIQRPNYLGQRVIFSPFLGLKWLKRNVLFGQDLLDQAGGLSIGQATVKYTSIGISAGFQGSWLLCWGLSLIGNADVAILYPYKRSVFQIFTPAVVIPLQNPIQITENHIRHLDIFAKGGVGINWGSYFCCNRYHVNLAATFDFMGDIIKMDSLTGSIFGNASIVLMGLSIRGQFEF